MSLVPRAIFCHTGQNELLDMTPEMLLKCHEAMRRCGEALPNVTENERRQTLDNLDRHYRIAANDLLRSALEAADRQGIEQIASFLETRGWLTGRRRLRADLARRSPPLRWLVSRITRLSTGYKRMRRSRWRKLALDQVLAQYASPRPAQAV